VRGKEVVKTGCGRAVYQSRTTAAIDADDPAGGIRAVKLDGLVIKMDIVGLKVCLDDIFRNG
jgi:hypothetical protein